jgi:hypothetical protein
MTTQPQDIQPALDHLEASLQASCATLIALQSARLAMHDKLEHAHVIEAQIGEAIASLGEAIRELRALGNGDASGLAFGFVLAAEPGWSGAQARRQRQVRPRRTA